MRLSRWRNELGATFITAIGLFPALIGALALISYGLDSDDYHFGSEVGGYIYRSPYYYIGTSVMLTFLFLAVVGLRKPSYKIFAVMLQAMILVLTVGFQ